LKKSIDFEGIAKYKFDEPWMKSILEKKSNEK